MAHETARFEDPFQFKGDNNDPYLTFIKSELLNDAPLSEEENYSYLANVDQSPVRGMKSFDDLPNTNQDTFKESCNNFNEISSEVVAMNTNWSEDGESSQSIAEEQTFLNLQKDNSSDKENYDVINKESKELYRLNSNQVSSEDVLEYLQGITESGDCSDTTNLIESSIINNKKQSLENKQSIIGENNRSNLKSRRKRRKGRKKNTPRDKRDIESVNAEISRNNLNENETAAQVDTGKTIYKKISILKSGNKILENAYKLSSNSSHESSQNHSTAAVSTDELENHLSLDNAIVFSIGKTHKQSSDNIMFENEKQHESQNDDENGFETLKSRGQIELDSYNFDSIHMTAYTSILDLNGSNDNDIIDENTWNKSSSKLNIPAILETCSNETSANTGNMKLLEKDNDILDKSGNLSLKEKDTVESENSSKPTENREPLNNRPEIKVSIRTLKLKQTIEMTKRGGVRKRKEFKCDVCAKEFSVFKTWLSHISCHYKLCNFCPARFTDFNQYTNHMYETHPVGVNVTNLEKHDFEFFVSNSRLNRKICVLCKTVFSSLEECINHIMEIHSYEIFIWKDKCFIKKRINKFFSMKFAFTIDCPLCKLCFEQESDFHTHMQSYHDSHSFCVKCNLYVFNSKLSQHVKQHAREERTVQIEYSCASCEMSYSSSEQLIYHSSKIECNYCDNTMFCSEDAFLKHQFNDHLDKMFGICSSCDTYFHHLDDLLNHLLTAHCFRSQDNKFQICDLCQTSSLIVKFYSSKKSLAQHMLSHHCILSDVNCCSIPMDEDSHIDLLPKDVKILHLTCILCSDKVIFPNVDCLLIHLHENHPKSLIGYCAPCGKAFHSNDCLLHAVEHFTSSGSEVICTTCNITYDTPASALHHIFSKHYMLVGQIPVHLQDLLDIDSPNQTTLLNKSIFTCTHCCLTTHGLLNHVFHLKTAHNSEIVLLKCKVCKTSHESLGSFARHKCIKPSRREKPRKAIVLGVEPAESEQNNDNISKTVWKYSGVLGEHSYAIFKHTITANTSVVHEEHDYV
uniref:C2H2-type domain-containing protein n=1 Tax=Cacopsylla melanoneura TaxID=428564 RepID=A0A8D8Y5G2_9HEMI